jgi:hypothetical protein
MPSCGPYCFDDTLHLTAAHFCPRCSVPAERDFKYIHIYCCEKNGCELIEDAGHGVNMLCIQCYGEQKARNTPSMTPRNLHSSHFDPDDDNFLDESLSSGDSSEKHYDGTKAKTPDATNPVSVPKWRSKGLVEIYNIFNPSKNEYQKNKEKWAWKNNVTFLLPNDKSKKKDQGTKSTHMGTIFNRLLTEMCKKNWLNQDESNKKAAYKAKEKSKQREEFEKGSLEFRLQFTNDIGDYTRHLHERKEFVYTFLDQCIKVNVNIDGDIISKDGIPINIGARIIMLTKEEESFDLIQEIYSIPPKEEERQILDDKASRVNKLWDTLAEDFLLDDKFNPENSWADTDSRIKDIDPRIMPEHQKHKWNGTKLRLFFTSYKSYFSKVEKGFKRTGGYQGGAGVYNGDEFFKLVEEELFELSHAEQHIVLFAFYAWDGYCPQVMKRSKPLENQYDTSCLRDDKPLAKRVKTESPSRVLGQAMKEAMLPHESVIAANNSMNTRNIAEAALYEKMLLNTEEDIKDKKIKRLQEAQKNPYLSEEQKEAIMKEYMKILLE